MNFIEINRNIIVNADHIGKITIDYPSKGKVTLEMAYGSYYRDIIINWLEWTNLRKRIGLYDVDTIDAVEVEQEGETKCK